MPRSIVLGNGSLMVGLDQYARVADFYFPHVGFENHSANHPHKIGFWIDGHMSWTDSGEWEISSRYKKDSMIGETSLHNSYQEVSVKLCDGVYNEKNIFIREITITNDSESEKTINTYLHQEFEISESSQGITAYYDPNISSVVHYRGRRMFAVGGLQNGRPIREYATGNAHYQSLVGSWRDAEDGSLSCNPIEHGTVDSTLGYSHAFGPGESIHLYYWVIAAKDLQEVYALNEYVIQRTPRYILTTTEKFWSAWVNKQNFSFYGLNDSVVNLFKTSLLAIRTHIDAEGGIIASCDSDLLQYGKDTYAYVWPRDGAFVAMALTTAGYGTVVARYFEFTTQILRDEGYLMQKYRPDGSLGASWHPWVRDRKNILPIQEDETALMLVALWHHYVKYRDLEFIEGIFNSFIKKSANFLARYIDPDLGLPYPSYDLWEEKYGSSTFTAASVYGGLIAASRFAGVLGKQDLENKYSQAAQKVKDGILKHLYDKKSGIFYKQINTHFESEGKSYETDEIVDASSVYGLMFFEVLKPNDEVLKKAMREMKKRLANNRIGGVPRYEGDKYHSTRPDSLGNPWIICTLWFAEYEIEVAETEQDLASVVDSLNWAVKHASEAGLLSEQLDPDTGEHLSVRPLTWSHSQFVFTVLKYLEKIEKLGICNVCLPPVVEETVSQL